MGNIAYRNPERKPLSRTSSLPAASTAAVDDEMLAAAASADASTTASPISSVFSPRSVAQSSVTLAPSLYLRRGG